MFIFDTDTTTINKSEKGNITCGNDLFRTMSKGALDMFSVKYAGKKYPDNFTKEEICERLFNTVKDIFREDAVPVTKKWGRSLDLFIGTEPEEKNEHAVMFSRAITELIEEGKKKSSQKTICSKSWGSRRGDSNAQALII